MSKNQVNILLVALFMCFFITLLVIGVARDNQKFLTFWEVRIDSIELRHVVTNGDYQDITFKKGIVRIIDADTLKMISEMLRDEEISEKTYSPIRLPDYQINFRVYDNTVNKVFGMRIFRKNEKYLFALLGSSVNIRNDKAGKFLENFLRED